MSRRMFLIVTGPNGQVKRTTVENHIYELPLTTDQFPVPGPTFPGHVIGHIVIMSYKSSAALIPTEEGFTFGYGGTVQVGSYNDINANKPVYFHGYLIRIAFQDYAQLRTSRHHVPSYNRGNYSLIRTQTISVEGNVSPWSSSWPGTCTIRQFHLDPDVTNLSIWLPGPPPEGRGAALQQLMDFFRLETRGFTTTSTVAVTAPYTPRFWFLQAIHALPTTVQTLTLLVHTREHVDALSSSMEVASRCGRIEELRVDFLPNVHWTADIGSYDGDIRRLAFRGITAATEGAQVVSFLRNNRNINTLQLQGNVAALLPIIDWIGRWGRNLETLQLQFVEEEDTERLLVLIGQFKYKLQRLALLFVDKPAPYWLNFAIRGHSRTLRTLTLEFPDDHDLHACDEACEHFAILPHDLPALTRVEVYRPPCTSFFLSQILGRIGSVELKIRPTAGDSITGERNFQICPSQGQRYPIVKLELESINDMRIFRDVTRQYWVNAREFTFLALPIEHVPHALCLPTTVTHLDLQIRLEDEHHHENRRYSCEAGLFDHHFTGPHAHDVNDAIAPRLASLAALVELKICFFHNNGRWRSPSLGKCFALRVLDKLPHLQTFHANEVSRDVQNYVANRSVNDLAFRDRISVWNN